MAYYTQKYQKLKKKHKKKLFFILGNKYSNRRKTYATQHIRYKTTLKYIELFLMFILTF